ncbi:MAG: NADH-quinone oxidoreductase subunit NuoE [Actinomycetota bacterium]
MSNGNGGAPPLSAAFHASARKLIARYPDGRSRSALLPLLYLAQGEQAYVSKEAMREIADLLGLTRAEVAAVATFYTMFKRHPQGKWLVSICTQPSCTLGGANEVKRALEDECGIGCGGTTADGMVSLEEVECLCACDGAPVVSVNYENYERLGAEQLVEIVRTLRAGGAPPAAARGDVPPDFAGVNRRMSGLVALR